MAKNNVNTTAKTNNVDTKAKADATANADVRERFQAELGDISARLQAELGDVTAKLKAELGDITTELSAEMRDMKIEVNPKVKIEINPTFNVTTGDINISNCNNRNNIDDITNLMKVLLSSGLSITPNGANPFIR